jgi:hypothetical protein
MLCITRLWLPILLSAVAVFIASSIMHVLLKYHQSDYAQLPDEDRALDVMRGIKPGYYHFPFGTHKEMRSPAMVEKYKRGPVGLMTIFPSGPPAMQKFLGLWFVYCLIISVFVAYLTCRAVMPGSPYSSVFRIAGVAGFLAYGIAHLSNAIWKGQPWNVTMKELFDGLVYACITAAIFGWLWPH